MVTFHMFIYQRVSSGNSTNWVCLLKGLFQPSSIWSLAGTPLGKAAGNPRHNTDIPSTIWLVYMEDFPLDSVLGMIRWNLANRVATTFALPMVHNKSVVLSLEHNLETWRCEAFAFFWQCSEIVGIQCLKSEVSSVTFFVSRNRAANCQLWIMVTATAAIESCREGRGLSCWTVPSDLILLRLISENKIYSGWIIRTAATSLESWLAILGNHPQMALRQYISGWWSLFFSICIYLNVCAGRRSCGVYMHIHFLHTRIHIHLQTHPHIHTYIYMCVCVYVCMHVISYATKTWDVFVNTNYIYIYYINTCLSIYLSIYIYIYEAMPAVRGGRGSHRALQELSQQLGFSWLGGVELGSVARNWLIDGD